MLKLNAYLVFDGNCAEAMKFYEHVLGGKLMIMTNAESPMAAQTPKGGENRIMHARLDVDGAVLMASDEMMGRPYGGKHGFSLSLTYESVADAKRVFDGLSQGGTVTMPLGKTFWAEAFGMLTDKFGTHWMVNCEGPGK